MLIIRITVVVATALVFQSCIVNKNHNVNLEGMWRFSSEKILNEEDLPNNLINQNQQLFIIDSIYFSSHKYQMYGVNEFVEHGEYQLNAEQGLYLTNRKGIVTPNSTGVLEDLNIKLLTMKSKEISFSLPINMKYPGSKNYLLEVEGVFKKSN